MKPDACPKVFRIVLNFVVQCARVAAAASKPTRGTMVAPQMRVLEGRFGLASLAHSAKTFFQFFWRAFKR